MNKIITLEDLNQKLCQAIKAGYNRESFILLLGEEEIRQAIHWTYCGDPLYFKKQEKDFLLDELWGIKVIRTKVPNMFELVVTCSG